MECALRGFVLGLSSIVLSGGKKKDRQTDRQTHIHTDIQTYRQTDRQTYTHTYIHTDRQTDTHTYIHDIHTYTQTHTNSQGV